MSALKSLKLRIVGVSPLLMHNGQLADPMNEITKRLKAVSGKRAKTDADFEEMARLEWYGSLYLKDGLPCIPGWVLEATFADAAKKSKRGRQAQVGILFPDDYPLHYKDEADDIDELWNAKNHRLTTGVRVQRNRVMRTRPKFEDWSAEIELLYDPSQLNERDIFEIAQTAGEVIGLMDYRPKFGRFEVKKV